MKLENRYFGGSYQKYYTDTWQYKIMNDIEFLSTDRKVLAYRKVMVKVHNQ